MLKRSTEDERVAKAAEKEQQRLAGEKQKAAATEQRRLAQEAQQRASQRKAFDASPAGRARAAFKNGDRVFQFFIDVKDTKPIVIAMVGATTSTSTADPVAILNSVCHEGWDLVNGSFVFHELGSESRDKFLASGQNVAVRGTIIGYYLFRRCEENKIQLRDVWEIPALDRYCPHCGAQINATARVCTTCGEPSEEWQWKDERWWRRESNDWFYLDGKSGEWMRHVTTPPTQQLTS